MKKSINIALPVHEKVLNTSFEAIYNRYHPIVLRYMVFRIRRKEIAEELTNDVFISMFKHFDSYDSSKSLITTWLFTFVKNEIIDYYRHTNTKRAIAFANMATTSEQTDNSECVKAIMIPDMGLKADSLHDTAIVCKNIIDSIENLKGLSKEIAKEYFMNDLSHNEIVEKLSIPLGTVKGTINRIREKLQVTLAKDYQLICQ